MTDRPPAHVPRLLAHRGASARWPEHSRAAFEQAVEDGADGIECDVRLTRDQVLVCWHDATVDRTTDATGAVHDLTLDELRRLRLHPRRGASQEPGADHRVVTLAELVELMRAAGRPLELAVEIKHPNPFGRATEDAVLELLRAAGWDPATGAVGPLAVTFMAFDPGSLLHLASGAGPARVAGRDLVVLTDELDADALVADLAPGQPETPELVRTLRDLVDRARGLVEDGVVGRAGPSVAFVRARGHDVGRWRAAGTRVRVWTVDDADDLAVCRELGVDDVVTDDPGALRRLLDPT